MMGRENIRRSRRVRYSTYRRGPPRKCPRSRKIDWEKVKASLDKTGPSGEVQPNTAEGEARLSSASVTRFPINLQSCVNQGLRVRDHMTLSNGRLSKVAQS